MDGLTLLGDGWEAEKFPSQKCLARFQLSQQRPITLWPGVPLLPILSQLLGAAAEGKLGLWELWQRLSLVPSHMRQIPLQKCASFPISEEGSLDRRRH